MQNRIHILAVGTLMVLTLGAALSVQASPPKPIVAVFSEDDPQFSETITLYADGKYQQAETEKKMDLYQKYSVYSGCGPLQNISSPEPFLLKLQLDPKRNGTWRVLDKEGGQPIVFKTFVDLPEDAVIEVKGAMPFGITWERQFPYQSHGTRTLSASEFQPAPPKK